MRNRTAPKLWALIMAGGTGERLWPLSRRRHPKQTLKLGSKRSLLQVAAERLRGLVPDNRIVVVTTKNQAAIVRRQVPKVSAAHFLVEPASRNTAAAVGLGTLAILQEDADAVILVTPADHLIRPVPEFHVTARRAASLAVERDGLVCLGIKPTYPATGYGYIEPMGKRIPSGGYRVRRFIEKPMLAVAQELIRRPGMAWNSGIFCWRARVILAAIRQWLPGLYSGLERIEQGWGTPAGKDRLSQLYRQLPSISIDVGVLERSRHVWVVPAGFSWDDVGSWNSLAFLHEADRDGNVVLGSYVGLETTGSVIVGENRHLVATLGVKDLIIVQAPDATLVCHKSQAQGVRKLVALMAGSRAMKRYL
ncbi:MAG: mannose-1-phosphate guanylyltransferase [Candidatus Omnitrophica bacterium]|nr:mannose-1-phosphate guanylyltransferase [Candidatus Omnitrophota bacterium]